MTSGTSILFSPRGLCNRLRANLPAEQKLRSLFYDLSGRVEERRRDEEAGLGQERLEGRGICRVFSAGSPQQSVDCVLGPVLGLVPSSGATTDGTLSLGFRVRHAARFAGRECRAWLFDAATLGRLWHAYWSRRAWFEAPNFDARPPHLDRVARRLVVPPVAQGARDLLPPSDGVIRDAAALAEGAYVALRDEGTVLLARRGEPPTRNSPHESRSVRCLAALPDGRRVVGAEVGGPTLIWRADQTEEVVRIHTDREVTRVAALPGDRVVLGLSDGTVTIHDASRGKLIAMHRIAEGRILQLAGLFDGSLAVCGGAGRVHHWRPGSGPVELVGVPEATALTVTPEGGLLAGASNGRLTSWSPGLSPDTRYVQAGAIRALAALPDGRRLQANCTATCLCAPEVNVPLARFEEETILSVDPSGRALFAADRAARGGLVARDLDRSAPLDEVLALCFREDFVDTLHAARLLATTAELNGRITADGRCLMTGDVPRVLPRGRPNLVEEADLGEYLVIAVAIDAA